MSADDAEHASFLRDWRRWHEDRLGAVNAPEGNAALAATHWLDASDQIPGIPGRWRHDADEVSVTLLPSDQALIGAAPTDGEVVAFARGFEIGTLIRFPERSAQVTRRRGQFGVRVYEHARANSVQSIQTFSASPAWVIPGIFSPLPPGAVLDYRFQLEDSARPLPTPGRISFELAGHPYEARPFLDDGALLIVFADRTTGRTSKPPSRFLLVDPPSLDGREQGGVTIDFNRAFLPPCAFSTEYNCPLPPPGHRFDVAITAGETFAQLVAGRDRDTGRSLLIDSRS